MKKIVFACLDQMLHFDTKAECNAFLEKMKKSKSKYKIEDVQDTEGGAVNVRIKRQYGDNAASFDEYLKYES